MKKTTACCLALAALSGALHAAAFSHGNLVVYRVGDGASALSSAATAVFLDEYTPGGALVQSIPLPTTGSGANFTLTASGTATSEGFLNLSADRTSLTLTGYNAAPGTASVATTTSATIARTIGLVDGNGVIDTTTTTTAFSATNIRSAVSTNGTDLWLAGGNQGIIYTTKSAAGAGTLVSSTFTNLRDVDIFDGQLYVAAAAGGLRLGTVGTGIPITTGQTITLLPGIPTATVAYNQFVMLDLSPGVAGVDTLYTANESTGGGIEKYSLVGGTWTSNGLVLGLTLRGLTASASSGTASIFATSANTIFSLTDASGYNGAFVSALTPIATAGTNTAFRGLDFTPVPEPSPVATLAGSFAVLGVLRRWRRRMA